MRNERGLDEAFAKIPDQAIRARQSPGLRFPLHPGYVLLSRNPGYGSSLLPLQPHPRRVAVGELDACSFQGAAQFLPGLGAAAEIPAFSFESPDRRGGYARL